MVRVNFGWRPKYWSPRSTRSVVAKIISKTQIPPKPYQIPYGGLRNKTETTVFEWFFWKKLQRSGFMKLRQLFADAFRTKRLSKWTRAWKRSSNQHETIFYSILASINPKLASLFKELWHNLEAVKSNIAALLRKRQKKELIQSVPGHKILLILIGRKGISLMKRFKLALENKFQAVALGNTKVNGQKLPAIVALAPPSIKLTCKKNSLRAIF